MQTSSAISAPGLRAALITYAVALQDWMAPSVLQKKNKQLLYTPVII